MKIDPQSFIVGAIVGLASAGIFSLIGKLFRPWLRSCLCVCPVPFFVILGISLRGNPALLLIDSYITLRHEGVDTSIREVESVFMNRRVRVSGPDDLVQFVKEYRKNQEVQPTGGADGTPAAGTPGADL